MVLGKLPVPGRPTIWITVGQGPTALAEVRVGVVWTFYSIYPFSPLSPSLQETARYRLKYCLKWPLSPKQPTNLTTTKTEHSRILKYEMGIFSEIVRLIYSSVYFFKVTHFNRDITL